MLDWGGQAVLIGVPKLGTEATFVVNQLYNDKSSSAVATVPAGRTTTFR